MFVIHDQGGKNSLLRIAALFVLCLVGAGCPAEPFIFDVGEMIEEVTSSSANVCVQLGYIVYEDFYFKMGYDTSSHASDHAYSFETPVRTGLTGGEMMVFSIPGGLSPDTKYYYSVAFMRPETEYWIWMPERSFHTWRAPGSAFRFCVIADLHYDGTLDSKKIRVQENVEADEPDFVITLGDMTPFTNDASGEPGAPVDCEVAYVTGPDAEEEVDFNFKYFTRYYMQVFAHSSLLLWVNGNHEGLAGYLAECPQFDHVLDARKRYLPFLNNDEPNAFFGDLVWGDAHIIWLDPLAFVTEDPLVNNDPAGYDLGIVQREWLTSTLINSSSKWKMIFAHTLFGGAGPSFECHPQKSYARGNANFVDNPGTDQIVIQNLMDTHGVSAYLYGHDHLYSVSEYNDVKYIVVGHGHWADWSSCLPKYYLPWRTIDSIGHLRVDVNADYLKISYIKAALDQTNGDVLDIQYIY